MSDPTPLATPEQARPGKESTTAIVLSVVAVAEAMGVARKIVDIVIFGQARAVAPPEILTTMEGYSLIH